MLTHILLPASPRLGVEHHSQTEATMALVATAPLLRNAKGQSRGGRSKSYLYIDTHILTCPPNTRHTLSKKDKKAYIDAQLCVMRTPRKVALSGAVTEYDEQVSIHRQHALTIHSTSIFPWHRWYLTLHELLLKECG